MAGHLSGRGDPMTQYSKLSVQPGSTMQDAEVKMLAARALSVLASKATPRPAGVQQHLEALCDAYTSPDEDERHDAILRIRQEGIAPRDIITHIIPETARLLGIHWANDTLSFSEVSIAAARLQETVRALAAKDQVKRHESLGTVLLVVPRPEHHTLGLFVAADRFRRLGYEVDISVSQHPCQISDRVLARRYAMVGATASSRRTLASIKDLVDSVRARVPRKVKVVVGGSVLDQKLDIVALTGADYSAPDAQSALKLCGLTISQDSPLERTTAN
ncbi:cobalamin B12-binding domain-containing protein [Rhodophyticola porphyridii]|uniref:B12-binding domain-containing protein n=1 Tax=Rhodophyticola porphyridii TaxID=1852017 RepID=A0A3L9Y688_9RHOB|nr:cobalamin-dependent protein [Rhodophyticola porphyridii]RMA42778.1 hypothetical protein D9R08_08340 [Rhodophyticola porphyridii]